MGIIRQSLFASCVLELQRTTNKRRSNNSKSLSIIEIKARRGARLEISTKEGSKTVSIAYTPVTSFAGDRAARCQKGFSQRGRAGRLESLVSRLVASSPPSSACAGGSGGYLIYIADFMPTCNKCCNKIKPVFALIAVKVRHHTHKKNIMK